MSILPECDYCENTEGVKTVNGELVCPNCIDKVGKIDSSNAIESIQESIIPVNSILRQSRETDSRVEIRTDLFNAETVSIHALSKAINEDANITNKPLTLYLELQARYLKHKQLIFDLNQQVVEEGTKQRAIQIYMNTLANSLRAEERAKHQIADINYQPRPIKIPVSPKNIKASIRKIDKVALKNAAKELGIAEFTLRMICIQKSLTLEQVVAMVKKNISSAKAESNPAEPNESSNQIESSPIIESAPTKNINDAFIVQDDEIVDMTNEE